GVEAAAVLVHVTVLEAIHEELLPRPERELRLHGLGLLEDIGPHHLHPETPIRVRRGVLPELRPRRHGRHHAQPVHRLPLVLTVTWSRAVLGENVWAKFTRVARGVGEFRPVKSPRPTWPCAGGGARPRLPWPP